MALSSALSAKLRDKKVDGSLPQPRSGEIFIDRIGKNKPQLRQERNVFLPPINGLTTWVARVAIYKHFVPTALEETATRSREASGCCFLSASNRILTVS